MKMGELVVTSEVRDNEEKKEGSSSTVRWERFLARVSIRVLLVEADDSTRQIIGALLRKCSYKVASVSDGLKAWEVLKARPHNIDLILTEVELPSVSGYALLTLIMEHEICKNIPVIMMSAHDSVSTVYKCMLRGAADFLVKPIRTNELKNLWQHVWRRQSTSRPRVSLEDERAAQQKLEATAENNATTNSSSSTKSCSLGQDNSFKKGSDAQSSCGKLDLEGNSDDMTEAENRLLPKQIETPACLKLKEHCNNAKSDQNLHGCEIGVAESNSAVGNDNGSLARDGSVEQQKRGQNMNPYTEASNNRDVIDNASSKAIDFMAALCDYPRLSSYVNDVANNFKSSPELDLSLRRFNSNIFAHHYEKQMLNHSNASAFTRYVNKAMCSDANAIVLSAEKAPTVNADDNLSNNLPDSNASPKKSSLPHDKVISRPSNLTKEAENEYPTSSQRLLPIPFQVRATRVDVISTSVSAGYRSTIPPIACTPSPSPSPISINQQQNSFPQLHVDVINGKHLHQQYDQCPRISSNQSTSKQDQNLESLGDRTQLSPATDQSASSTLCNGNTGIFNAFGCTGNVHQDAMVPDRSKSGNEQSHANNHELSCRRSIQREAALTKFRLKRKERCFEKKVRYESRKKLAEQRPRVKGQFVRQFPPAPAPPKSDESGGTSMAN